MFELVGAVTRSIPHDVNVPIFPDHHELFRSVALDAVAICTPPGPRHDIARDCLAAGLHCLLEKPPCATLGEAIDLQDCAAGAGRTLFATWHARANSAVMKAAEITRAEGIASLNIAWMEDVNEWHAGQDWIWQPGGFGVFDSGINALSIVTLLSPDRVLARSATFELHTAGQQPIAAIVEMGGASGVSEMHGRFDWRHEGRERWTIDVVTGSGTRLAISEGGALLDIDDQRWNCASEGEYPDLYRRFAELIAAGDSDMDLVPLRLLTDIALVARRDP